MILGIGIDITELARIRRSLERFGSRFAAKILHPEELALLNDKALTSPHAVAHISARFAAKEAGAKALGSGFSGGVLPQDIRISSLPSGKPVISFHGQALLRMRDIGANSAHVSLTHSRDSAGAVVILEVIP